MLPMPRKKVGMRPIPSQRRDECPAVPIDYAPYTVRVVRLARDEYFEIVSEADQAAIEHPMNCSRQGEPVRDDIWSVGLDWSDMGCLYLGSAATIDFS